MKQSLLRIAKMTGGFALARHAMHRHLRVLAYHGLWTTPGFQYGDRLFISPEQFERRMTWLRRSRYPVLALDDAITALASGTLPANSVVITIDDGWKSTFTHMLPVLERLQLPATAYVTTWYVDNQSPILNVALNYVLQRSAVPGFVCPMPAGPGVDVRLGDKESRERNAAMLHRIVQEIPSVTERLDAFREICRLAEVPTEPWWSEGQFHLMTREEIKAASIRGLDIQLHTHRHRNVESNIEALTAELSDNRRVLAETCETDDFAHFCYPSGRYNPAAAGILAAAGIKSAMLCDHGLNAPGTDPYALRRFLDGRSVTQEEFEAFLCGALDIYATVSARIGLAHTS